MRSPLLALSLSVLLTGCATGQGATDSTAREKTIADQVLAFAASEKAGGDPTCRNRKVISAVETRPFQAGSQLPAGHWSERGTPVPYLVEYVRATDGHLGVSILREDRLGAAVIPGGTKADAVLQRDTSVLLAQKDLSETEGESCRTRRVTNTELLQSVEGAQIENGRPIAGQWTERWTLDRCGSPVHYIVRFSTTRTGTTLTAEREK